MGFGLLLIGYFTATVMSLNSLGGLFRFIGFMLICKGSKKLSDYNGSFLFLFVFSLISLAFSALCAVGDASVFLYNNLLISSPILPKVINDSIPYLKILFDFVFTALLCFCVRSISKETGAQKTVYTPIRNFVFYCIFVLIQFIVWLASYTKAEVLVSFVGSTMLPVWMLLINLICVILNCLMLFSCYARICDESDVEMPQKPSRFAFINQMRSDKEAKRQKYLSEAEAYLNKEQSKYTPEQQARVDAAEKAKKKIKHR